MNFPIKYQEPIFRPPSEGRSFLVQVTIGCSNNLCTYCDMYRSKKYKERDFKDISQELRDARDYFRNIGHMPKRIFLCDGDALGASQDLLVQTLKLINELFPNIERIGIYATAQNMLDKSSDELKELVQLKLNMAYLGLESGSDKILKLIVKGNNRADMIEGSLKLKAAGFKLSVIAMLGLGGSKFTQENIKETSSIISTIAPEYFSFLTTIAIPGTPYHRMASRPSFEATTTKELLGEMKSILEGIHPETDIIFRANHVSNQYPLGGVIPRDTPTLVSILKEWISATKEGEYPPIPSSM